MLFHLNKPMWEQFVYYWADMARLRFGISFAARLPVAQVVGKRIWPTVLLVGTGTIIAAVIGVFTGVFAGWRRNSKFDVLSTNTGMVLYSAPTFWICLIFIMIFSTWLRWFPMGRMYDPGVVYSSWFVAVHGIAAPPLPAGLHLRHHLHGRVPPDRAQLLTGVIKEDYVLTARAKGLSDSNVLWRHVAPNAMLPTVTLVMMNIGFVLSGAILVPRRSSTGQASACSSYDSMVQRDYPVMQAVFLLGSIAVIVANLIADIMYYYLDPRVKA